jgi:hypothetical protein
LTVTKAEAGAASSITWRSRDSRSPNGV